MSFYDYYLRLCNGVNKSAPRVNTEIGLSRNAHLFWRGKGSPRAATMQRIADYFGMSIDDLRYESTEEPKVKNIKKSDNLDELINLYRHASPALRRAAIAVLKSGIKE